MDERWGHWWKAYLTDVQWRVDQLELGTTVDGLAVVGMSVGEVDGLADLR